MFDSPQDDLTRRAMYPGMTERDWMLHDFLELYSRATPAKQAEIMRWFKAAINKHKRLARLTAEPFVECLN